MIVLKIVGKIFLLPIRDVPQADVMIAVSKV
jgi:hypothetical protein